MKLKNLELVVNNKICQFNIRESSTGDHGVIQQIFQQGDYDLSQWVQGARLMQYHLQENQSTPSLIIDAGANIGASVVYFLNVFENSFVYSIEPEINNWHLLEINTMAYRNKLNFHGAISNVDGEVTLEDPGYSDWGFRTQQVNTTQTQTNAQNAGNKIRVESICPRSIMRRPEVQNTRPLIFKIDIEGGESELFKGDTSWMDDFPLIIIELHDWMLPFSGSAKNFLAAVAKYDFDFVHRGENIFLFNRRILSPTV